jgi:hypothetical protein
MARKNLLHVSGGRAWVVIVCDETGLAEAEFKTLSLRQGEYVKVDDRALGSRSRCPQVCYGGSVTGQTITYHSPEQLARALRARLFKTQAGYENALTNLTFQSDVWGGE